MPAVSKFAEFDTAGPNPNRCKICVYLQEAPPVDKAYIVDLLAQPAEIKGNAHVARVLTKGGVPTNDKSVRNHRQNHVPA